MSFHVKFCYSIELQVPYKIQIVGYLLTFGEQHWRCGINRTLILSAKVCAHQKTTPLYPHPKHLFWILIRNLALVCLQSLVSFIMTDWYYLWLVMDYNFTSPWASTYQHSIMFFIFGVAKTFHESQIQVVLCSLYQFLLRT